MRIVIGGVQENHSSKFNFVDSIYKFNTYQYLCVE